MDGKQLDGCGEEEEEEEEGKPKVGLLFIVVSWIGNGNRKIESGSQLGIASHSVRFCRVGHRNHAFVSNLF